MTSNGNLKELIDFLTKFTDFHHISELKMFSFNQTQYLRALEMPKLIETITVHVLENTWTSSLTLNMIRWVE